MIVSFKSADTEALFAGKTVKRFVNTRVVAERKLQMLHRAVRLDDLRVPPQNRLKKIEGRPQRPMEHPHQRPMENLLQV